jgi:signal transduction histidine kinase
VPQGEEEPPFIIVVAEDVTERRRAEEALARARNELARVTRASTLGELAASIAHEVNQPLAAIVANGQAAERWMDRGAAGEPEARQAVQRIVRDANRAGEVVARVRRLLRQGELQREPLRMDQVVDEVLDLIRMEAQTSRIALLYEPPRGLPEVRADRVQVQQIVLNLLMNAMEAILARSSGARWVEVTLAATESPEGMEGHDAVRVDVRDSGIGLAPQDVDKVFDAFHTTKPGGMGMGLAISRSIVEAHGGRLWATPGAWGDPPAGAVFSFTLPCEPA